MEFSKPPNPWGRISEIAKRLGVQPYDGGRATITAEGADGKQYDIWEVVSAALDVVEAAIE